MLKFSCLRRMERPLHVEGLKTEKAQEPNRRKFNTRNLETESIRSRAESTGGCVKLKQMQK